MERGLNCGYPRRAPQRERDHGMCWCLCPLLRPILPSGCHPSTQLYLPPFRIARQQQNSPPPACTKWDRALRLLVYFQGSPKHNCNRDGRDPGHNPSDVQVVQGELAAHPEAPVRRALSSWHGRAMRGTGGVELTAGWGRDGQGCLSSGTAPEGKKVWPGVETTHREEICGHWTKPRSRALWRPFLLLWKPSYKAKEGRKGPEAPDAPQDTSRKHCA